MNATLATAIAGTGAGRAKETSTQLEELFDGVDDLMRRVANVENPEIRKLRARVHFAMVAAKGAVEGGAIDLRPQAVQADEAPAPEARVADDTDYIHDPRPALGVALLVGLGIGLIVSRRQ
jgi:ElaB/YqjD/DUF883 family membrane-anchored ribosome-binding protein